MSNENKNPFNIPSVLTIFTNQLESSTLTTHDLMKLRQMNSNFNQLTRKTLFDKTNKSVILNSDDKMKVFLDTCAELGPDIARSITFGPRFSPDSYLRLRSPLCPAISSNIRELTLCTYETRLDKLFETFAQCFTNLKTLQIRFHNLILPENLEQIRIQSITTLKVEMSVQRAACTPAALLPFLKGIFHSVPNLQHLDILEVQGRSFIETIVWDMIIEQDLKTLGLGNLVTLHRETVMSIPLGRRETYRKYLQLKQYLYDLKLSISYREDEISVEFINDFLSQLNQKITSLRLLDGVEEMIPLGFGSKVKELVLQSFSGSVRFIENLGQLESIKFVGIDMNSQLFNGNNNEEEDEAIVIRVLGPDSHPNLRSVKAYGCEGGDKILRILGTNAATHTDRVEVQNHPWLF